MTELLVRSHATLVVALHRVLTRGTRRRGDTGQTTAEYALVLLGAAGIALLLVAWATKSGAVSRLFDAVMSNVIGRVK